MSNCTVVITGASGSVYGMRLIEQLVLAGHEVSVIFTDAGREVTAFELGFDLPTQDAAVASVALAAFLELPTSDRIRIAYVDNLFDAVASGSHLTDAMVVCPCTMGFVGSIAAGLGSDLAERAADVMLKERRPLVLVPRETPLSLLHLRNLVTVAEAGAVVVPAMPAFYQRPESVDDLVNFVVGKVLDVLGVEHGLFKRWGESR